MAIMEPSRWSYLSFYTAGPAPFRVPITRTALVWVTDELRFSCLLTSHFGLEGSNQTQGTAASLQVTGLTASEDCDDQVCIYLVT